MRDPAMSGSTNHRQPRRPRSCETGERIGDGRGHRWHAGLANSGRRLGRAYHDDLNLRHLLHRERAIVMEIGNRRGAGLNGHFGVKRMTYRVTNPTFHLRADHVWIHNDTTIDGTPDLVD